MKSKIVQALFLSTAVMTYASASFAKTSLQLSSGVNYSSGDYGGTEDTDVVVASVAAKVKTGNWSFRASLPFLNVDGPANVSVIDDGGATVDNGSNVVRNSSESGIGDMSLTATYSFNKLAGENTYLDVSGRVRLPTGDDKKGLGTGATDYIVKGELGWDFSNKGFYVSGGHRFLGEANGFKRNDGWQAGAGAWINPTRKSTIGVFYDWREASTDTGEDPSEAGAFVSYKLTDTLKISLDASAGLSDGSPDYSAGTSLSWRPAL